MDRLDLEELKALIRNGDERALREFVHARIQGSLLIG
jgi:hypothetical protein